MGGMQQFRRGSCNCSVRLNSSKRVASHSNMSNCMLYHHLLDVTLLMTVTADVSKQAAQAQMQSALSVEQDSTQG